MLTAAICDDNALHLKQAEDMTVKVLTEAGQPFALCTFSSAEDLLLWMKAAETQPDIAVLDIEMGGEDGISLAKKLNASAPACRIIFLTSYVDYAPDAYEAEHIWFVVKARAEEHFGPAMEKALKSLAERDAAKPGLLVREDGRTVLLPLESVLYIGREGRKALVMCEDGPHYASARPDKLIPQKLTEYFLRCHQGYWVNLAKIAELDHEEFVLKNGARIPISRGFREEAKRRFFDLYRL